jgi:WbqC-like protein family
VKRVAILQSNYIPWKGYFDLVARVDEFVLYDDMQYTRRDWRNRNQIKTPQGVQWLTVPVKVKGKFTQKINETEIDGTEWAEKHVRTLTQNYARAPYFREILDMVSPVYTSPPRYLSELNRRLIEVVCEYLRIKTKIVSSSDYSLKEGKTERLVDLCLQANATEYISGPAAKDYIQEELFREAGVTLGWFDYSGFPPYPQLYGEFVHGVTILDLLSNCGENSSRYMRFVEHL